MTWVRFPHELGTERPIHNSTLSAVWWVGLQDEDVEDYWFEIP